jgi:hypothetical protein
MHPLPAGVHISSDDSQLAPLLDKDKGPDTEASQGNTGGYSFDQPMTSPPPGLYQKLSNPLPGSSPIQVQKTLSERSCTVLLDIYA